MSDSVPTADRLLDAAAAYLEDELQPQLSGYYALQTRICANVLRIVQRELRHGPALEQAEAQRLQALLGQQGDERKALDAALADRIASGALPLDAPELLEHLRETLQSRLRVNNPKWTQRP
ncbi:DUF6285 domain-containing protein [Ramlibacter sp. AN1015]|uniref:DUF6285 domain-containing protein n=1 Tax=Ramlibacter sp. AN1015 TaxID=3133428 RepID=UPI0030C162F3